VVFNVIYYLKNLTCPDHLVEHKRRALRLKSMKYFLTEDGLGWRNPDGVILRCVNKEEADKLMATFIQGIVEAILQHTPLPIIF
jgi:hypothetical protein